MGRNAQEINEARDFLARNGVDGSKMAIKDLRSEEARITQELAEEKAKRKKEATKKGDSESDEEESDEDIEEVAELEVVIAESSRMKPIYFKGFVHRGKTKSRKRST